MPSMVHIKGVVSLTMPLLFAFVAISILVVQETAQLVIPTGQIFRSLMESLRRCSEKYWALTAKEGYGNMVSRNDA